MSNVNLVRTIQTKLPAAGLDKVCENAPDGYHPDGGTYRDHCLKCIGLADESENLNSEQQALCVAQVIASFIETEEPEAANQLTEPAEAEPAAAEPAEAEPAAAEPETGAVKLNANPNCPAHDPYCSM